MSEFIVKVEHKPRLGSEQEMTCTAMRAKISALPVKWRDIDLEDVNYFYVNWQDWKKVIEHLKSRVPDYLTDKFDCDNMARWFNSEVARVFRINTCAIVEGWCNGQRHKWNVFYDGEEFYQLEPQNGVIMDIDDPKYVPDEIVVG